MSDAKAADNLVARGLAAFRQRLEAARAERATGSVTLEVYLKDGVPHATPKVILSTGAK